jgi:hypothetical protein
MRPVGCLEPMRGQDKTQGSTRIGGLLPRPSPSSGGGGGLPTSAHIVIATKVIFVRIVLVVANILRVACSCVLVEHRDLE